LSPQAEVRVHSKSESESEHKKRMDLRIVVEVAWFMRSTPASNEMSKSQGSSAARLDPGSSLGGGVRGTDAGTTDLQ
jgi:hypothetical protein